MKLTDDQRRERIEADQERQRQWLGIDKHGQDLPVRTHHMVPSGPAKARVLRCVYCGRTDVSSTETCPDQKA